MLEKELVKRGERSAPVVDGRRDKEPERMRAGLLRLHDSLSEANIYYIFYESPETDHQWQTWRRDLEDFAQDDFNEAFEQRSL